MFNIDTIGNITIIIWSLYFLYKGMKDRNTIIKLRKDNYNYIKINKIKKQTVMSAKENFAQGFFGMICGIIGLINSILIHTVGFNKIVGIATVFIYTNFLFYCIYRVIKSVKRVNEIKKSIRNFDKEMD